MRKLGYFIAIVFFLASAAKAAAFSPPTAKDESFAAKFVSQSAADPIALKAGQSKEVTITFKNTGNAVWPVSGVGAVSVYTVDPKYRDSDFSGESWPAKSNPAKIVAKTKSGQTASFKIKLYAPKKAGEYLERFALAAENKTWVKGGYFFLKIKVEAPAEAIEKVGDDISVESPTSSLPDATTTPPDPASTTTRALINEPNIRVGLYKADDPVEFQSDFPYQVYGGQNLQGTFYAGGAASISYASGSYSYQSDDLNFDSADPIRLVPDDPHYFFTLANYDRRVSYRDKNFNAYRGTMEFRYSQKSDAPFVINELPLDEYVAGIAETSNNSAPEYVKALLVAARGYAFANLGPVSSKRLFDMVPTTADQLYLGYNSEVLMPRVAQAAQDTGGEMVTYNGNPVVTPYFGHSDGRTRDWSEVWGGADKAWLASVKTPYDKGLRMWGHGVGMSGNDASHRADKDGWTYSQILQYYYSGTQVEKIY